MPSHCDRATASKAPERCETEVIFRAAARIKGIKRHVAADGDGLPLGVVVTTANIRDSKAAYRLIGSIGARHPYIKTIKAENGYRGKLIEVAKQAMAIDMRCVKSNFGTSKSPTP